MATREMQEVLRRLDEFERQATVWEREAVAARGRLEDKVDQINGKVGKLEAEIGPALPNPAERKGRETLQQRMHKVEQDRAAIEHLASTLGVQVETLNRSVNEIAPAVEQMVETQKIAKAVSDSQARIYAKMGRLVIYSSSVTAAIVGTAAVIFKWVAS